MQTAKSPSPATKLLVPSIGVDDPDAAARVGAFEGDALAVSLSSPISRRRGTAGAARDDEPLRSAVGLGDRLLLGRRRASW
jgi:hypothetical protein